MWLQKLFFPEEYAIDFRIIRKKIQRGYYIENVYYIQYQSRRNGHWHMPVNYQNTLRDAQKELQWKKDIANFHQNKEWRNVEVL